MPNAVIPASRTDVVYSNVKFTNNRVILPDDLSYDDWESAFQWCRFAVGTANWWLGDLLNAGETRYGEKYSQAMDAGDWDYQTLANVASVSRRVPPENRCELSWSHHRAVASMEPDAQRAWLDSALAERWTATELMTAIRESKPKAFNPLAVSAAEPESYPAGELSEPKTPTETPIPEPATPKDANGNPIPQHLWPVFATRTQFDELMADAMMLRRNMLTLADMNPGNALRKHMVERENAKPKCRELDAVVDMVKQSKPHAVCCYCGGAGGDCTGCYDGWMTVSQWKGAPKDKRVEAGEVPF